MFRAVSGEGGLMGGKFENCFGRFRGGKIEGRRHVSGGFRGGAIDGEANIRNVSGSLLAEGR